MQVTVFPINDPPYDLDIEGAQKLNQLQKIVEGYIEIHPCNPDKLFIVNEDGRLFQLKANKHYPQFCGVVVVINAQDFD